MKPGLRLLRLYFPSYIKKKKLEKLFAVTADAFGHEVPSTQGLAFEQCLHKYALFTKEQTERYLEKPSDIDGLKEELFRGAYRLGSELRREFDINTFRDAMLMMEIVYKLLGIHLERESKNEVVIKQCFFSRYYSPEICRVISSLDEGLAAGLSDGGELSFYQRITEGNSFCRANLLLKEVRK